MCCEMDEQAMAEFLADLGPRRTFVGWKILSPRGEALIGRQQYKPGTNVPNRLLRRYRPGNPTGLHVYIDRWYGEQAPYDCAVVRVECHRDDVIRMAYGQAVLSKLIIRKKYWLEAGLPKEAVKR